MEEAIEAMAAVSAFGSVSFFFLSGPLALGLVLVFFSDLHTEPECACALVGSN